MNESLMESVNSLVASIKTRIETMSSEDSTCRECKFKYCPSISLAVLRLSDDITRFERYASNNFGRKESETTYTDSDVEGLLSALRKIQENSSFAKDDLNSAGFAYRTAKNALDEFKMKHVLK